MTGHWRICRFSLQGPVLPPARPCQRPKDGMSYHRDAMTVTMNRRELIGLCGGAAVWPYAAHAQQRRLLYLTHSAGYRHDAIPLSRTILGRIGQSSGLFDVTATEDVSQL